MQGWSGNEEKPAVVLYGSSVRFHVQNSENHSGAYAMPPLQLRIFYAESTG